MDGIRRFMLFRGEWHPEVTGMMEREAFLSDLAVKSNVASFIRNHAPDAIVFHRQILRKGSGWPERIERVKKKPARRPIVFTRDEERAVLARLDGVRGRMASGLRGFGLRLMEDAGGASGTSDADRIPSSDPGFDYKLPCD